MKRIHPTTELETEEEQRSGGRYNAATIMKYGKNRYILTCGRSDDNYFWKDLDIIYILNLNYRYGYVGLQVFYIEEEPLNELIEESSGAFFQYPAESIGEDWEDKSPVQLRDILLDYV